jgi:hypothetical protein
MAEKWPMSTHFLLLVTTISNFNSLKTQVFRFLVAAKLTHFHVSISLMGLFLKQHVKETYKLWLVINSG